MLRNETITVYMYVCATQVSMALLEAHSVEAQTVSLLESWATHGQDVIRCLVMFRVLIPFHIYRCVVFRRVHWQDLI